MVGKKFPLLIGFADSETQVKAWCPYCKKWHIHGYPDKKKGRKIGHWSAHCTNAQSPFKDGGYEIKLLTKKEIGQIADSIEFYAA